MKQTPVSMTFDNWSEFINTSEYGTPVRKEWGDSREIYGKEHPWPGTETFEQAVSLARRGWPEGTKKALKISKEIETKLYSLIEVPQITYDVTGELLDISRFCSGEPEHWGVFSKTLHEGRGTKYVHLVVNGCYSSGIDTYVIIARGAILSALVNLLELGGCRVKVTSSMCHSYGGSTYSFHIPLKDYDEVLDLDRVSYAIAHPSTLRRHIFSIMESTPDCQAFGAYGSYGRPENTTETGDIYIPKMRSDEDMWNTPESTVKWVTTHLEQQGVIKPQEVP